MLAPPGSPFTEAFLRVNRVAADFAGWLLDPGMLFGAESTWWGERAARERPHEGLDLAAYRGEDGRIVRLDGSTRLSAMYDGVVVGVFDDFLGRSLLLAHAVVDEARGRLFSAFGHTRPDGDVVAGRMVRAGEPVASVAGPTLSSVPPHVHISVGWARNGVTEQLLDWRVLPRADGIVLIDPLPLIEEPGAGVSELAPLA